MKKNTDMHSAIAAAAKSIIEAVGENPQRDGLKKTPDRVARAYAEITSGYNTDFDKLFNGAFFKSPGNELVTVTDISFYSLCEHHMLPFFGKVHIGYIPDKKIVGLSKIPRLVRALSARLQLQERLTRQIADILDEKLDALGVAVVIEARHLCIEMRGAKTSNSYARTSVMTGEFKKNPAARSEFLTLIARKPV